MTLRERSEAEYGQPMSDDEFREAEKYARMKLRFQNDLYERDYGDDYLAILIAETARSNKMYSQISERATEYIESLTKNDIESEERKWVEETADSIGVPSAAVRELVKILGYPYCSTLYRKKQYGGMKNVG